MVKSPAPHTLGSLAYNSRVGKVKTEGTVITIQWIQRQLGLQETSSQKHINHKKFLELLLPFYGDMTSYLLHTWSWCWTCPLCQLPSARIIGMNHYIQLKQVDHRWLQVEQWISDNLLCLIYNRTVKWTNRGSSLAQSSLVNPFCWAASNTLTAPP